MHSDIDSIPDIKLNRIWHIPSETSLGCIDRSSIQQRFKGDHRDIEKRQERSWSTRVWNGYVSNSFWQCRHSKRAKHEFLYFLLFWFWCTSTPAGGMCWYIDSILTRLANIHSRWSENHDRNFGRGSAYPEGVQGKYDSLQGDRKGNHRNR